MSQHMTSGASAMEPMSGDQASRLKMLAAENHEPRAFQDGLSSHEASHRINVLKEKIRIDELPPHTD